jgi:hypothetical protein
MNALRIIAITAAALSVGTSVFAIPAASAADAPAPPALAGTPTTPPAETSIPFARRNIWNWEADGEKGIWVQAIGRQWYYGKFLSPCTDLPFREGVHFRFGPAGELDEWGAIIMPHLPDCILTSFTLSDGPPHRKKSKPPAVTAPAPAPPTAAPTGTVPASPSA